MELGSGFIIVAYGPTQWRVVRSWPMRIRNARAPDLPALRSLLEAAGLPTDGMEAHFPDGYAVMETDNALCGAAGCAPLSLMAPIGHTGSGACSSARA
jgi:hypothetical protein